MNADTVLHRPDPFPPRYFKNNWPKYLLWKRRKKKKSHLLRLYVYTSAWKYNLTWASTQALQRLGWHSDAAPSSQTIGTEFSEVFGWNPATHTHTSHSHNHTLQNIFHHHNQRYYLNSWHLYRNNCGKKYAGSRRSSIRYSTCRYTWK